MLRVPFILLALTGLSVHAGEKEPLLVMAASSLTNVLPEVASAWKAQGGESVTFHFEATSRLAGQIESGAPGDLFFSADREWMDHLEDKDRIEKDTRVTLLSNRIVLVVPSDSRRVPASAKDLLDPSLRHLALAGESVPAGKLARAALTSEGVLDGLRDRIVNAENVRAALQWVARQEAGAGIVFQTDARIEPRVRVAFAFPESAHPRIEYPAAVVRGSKRADSAREFLAFCRGRAAREIFRSFGFVTVGGSR